MMQMRKVVTISGVVLTLVVSAIAFQNCGKTGSTPPSSGLHPVPYATATEADAILYASLLSHPSINFANAGTNCTSSANPPVPANVDNDSFVARYESRTTCSDGISSISVTDSNDNDPNSSGRAETVQTLWKKNSAVKNKFDSIIQDVSYSNPGSQNENFTFNNFTAEMFQCARTVSYSGSYKGTLAPRTPAGQTPGAGAKYTMDSNFDAQIDGKLLKVLSHVDDTNRGGNCWESVHTGTVGSQTFKVTRICPSGRTIVVNGRTLNSSEIPCGL